MQNVYNAAYCDRWSRSVVVCQSVSQLRCAKRLKIGIDRRLTVLDWGGGFWWPFCDGEGEAKYSNTEHCSHSMRPSSHYFVLRFWLWWWAILEEKHNSEWRGFTVGQMVRSFRSGCWKNRLQSPALASDDIWLLMWPKKLECDLAIT